MNIFCQLQIINLITKWRLKNSPNLDGIFHCLNPQALSKGTFQSYATKINSNKELNLRSQLIFNEY